MTERTADAALLTYAVGDQFVLALKGELDLALALTLQPVLGEALPPRPGTVVVNLGQVTFMDCSGLALLCRLRERVVDRGGRLVLLGPRPVVRRLLRLAPLDERFVVIERLLPARTLN
ncbi:STAS domain-containing protein [Streptomyces chrestomyceticus]|uniref:Anti-sigma factor antagonist n=2 Tax=Streptomyces chrestomyceticus TaxID=68185 RepID=A0A7U9L2Y3_9ACTN|nr:STAS domain-containing protein [Streptomyces chrestomyceticus]GCD39258.1 anti-sigma factor antagonist [Streptomyces chrestomyceticus JCM 4735]